MKKIMITSLLAVCTFAFLQAQGDPFQKFFRKYENREGYTLVNIAGSVQIIAADDECEDAAVNFYDELKPLIENERYTKIMNVSEKDQKVAMITDSETNAFYIIVGGEDNAVIRLAEGTDLEDIAGMLEGMGDLEVILNSTESDATHN